MTESTKSTAGPRQFESTAIAKLRARGVPKHVADAFVKIGIPKSGRQDSIKDVVCAMTYKKYFIERSGKDFEDPLRVGFYEPVVIPNGETRFHCEFEMTDIESSTFSMLFPEFNVISRGRTYNQHAFYANKRYAEAELLIGMVHRDSLRSGLNSKSIVDLGGNGSWHSKRGRDYVHCDNPLLSARDKMRYETRRIFSGDTADNVCQDKFNACSVEADYAIAVHATYDLTPKTIAAGMLKRGIKRFFGVINYIPGVEDKPAGLYASDGLEIEIVRPSRQPAYAVCGFSHDPSLRYEHKLSHLKSYLLCQKQYDFVDSNGDNKVFTYSIRSVRGNSIVFSIDDLPRGVSVNPTPWSSVNSKTYRITLDFLGIKNQDVSCEFFDRIVLQACSARNNSNYDIVSLFRYAKSLRQRVSMNGIVLSSGFTHRPDELVNVVIAAYATACAYRVESGNFFKEATAQINSSRYKGFVNDVITVFAKTLKTIALLLPYGFSRVTGLHKLGEKIKALIHTNTAVEVVVSKPCAGKGLEYDPYMFKRRSVMNRVKQSLANGSPIVPYSRYYGASLLPTGVRSELGDFIFYSRGLINYDASEAPRKSKRLDISTLEAFDGRAADRLGEVRDHYHAQVLARAVGVRSVDSQRVTLPNGDVMCRLALSQFEGMRYATGFADAFVSAETPYVIVRGVGRYAVKLNHPKCYDDGRCSAFYLCFESRTRVERTEGAAADGVDATDLGSVTEVDEAVASPGSDLRSKGWSGLCPGNAGEADVRMFATKKEADDFAEAALLQGEYYMSGALVDPPATTPREPTVPGDDLVFDVTESGEGIVDTVDVDADSADEGDARTVLAERDDAAETVSSSEVSNGRDAMEEFVEICDRSRSVALASAKMVMDMVKSAAKGDDVSRYFKAVVTQHPGNVKAVSVKHDDRGAVRFYDYHSRAQSEELDHMAVSDGDVIYDRTLEDVPDGLYVTSDVMKIFTGAAMRDAVAGVVDVVHTCRVTCVDGIAGSGKSYTIIHGASPGDVVLCETKAALEDTASELHKIPGWTGHAYTVDSFLMHTPVRACGVLWIDEAFRLHAGKIYALIKLLKPTEVRCFGDSKQIPPMSFIPGMDLVHHEYPYSSIQIKTDTWRFGADVCFALSEAKYYGYNAVTHCKPLRSMKGPLSFVQGVFHGRPPGTALLVYTKTARDDLRKQGVKGVMTIGESQGKTFDHVWLFRESTLNKALYHDLHQTLVAVTRHRYTFRYYTVCSPTLDDSAVAAILFRNAERVNEVVLSSHLCPGVRPVSDYTALLDARRAPSESGQSSSGSEESSIAPEVTSAESDWSLFEDEEDE